MSERNQTPQDIVSTDGMETNPSITEGPTPTPTSGLTQDNERRDLFSEREREKAPPTTEPKHRPITMGKPVPTERRAPTSSYFAKKMSPGYNIQQSESDQKIISVQPRMTDWIIPFSHFVQERFDATEFENFRRVSPHTLMAYFFYAGISRLLIFDLTSSIPSDHAKKIRDSPSTYHFVRQLSDLSIPKPIAEVFENINPASLAGSFKFRFVPTLAGFLHNYDFGKFIHPQAFLAMHNGIVKGGISLTEELNLMRTKLYTAGATDIRLGNFFSKFCNVEDTWYQNNHWVSMAVDGLTVPYTNRYNVRRPQFATIPIDIPDWNGATSNAYSFLLSLSDQELQTTFSWVSELNEYVATNFKDAVYLEDTLNASHNGIFHHYISSPLLPGSTTNDLGYSDTQITANTATPDLKFERYITAIHFGTTFDHGIGIHPVLNPTAAQATRDLYYGSASTTEPTPATREFEYTTDYSQRIRLFSPTIDTVLAHHRTLLSGIMIENGSIDAYSLPMPNPFEHLMSWKTRIMNSTIRADRTVVNPTEDRVLIDRPVDLDITGSSTFLLFNQKENRLAKTATQYTGTHPHTPYFTIHENWNGSTPPITVLSPTANTISNGTVKVDLWSSYRWISPGKRGSANTYILPSLYHIFGLAAETCESEQMFKLLRA